MQRLIPLIAIMFLTACGSLIEVPVVEDKTPIMMPEDAQPSPIRFTRNKVSIPRGSEIGAISPRGFSCKKPWGYLPSRMVISNLEREEMKESFDATMESLGYDVTGRSTILFDEEDDILRTLYSVGANIQDIKIDLCNRGRSDEYLFSQAYGGEAYLDIEWTVYDQLHRKTVYKTKTQGYSNLKVSNEEGVGYLLDDAFAAAAHNLGADRGFYNLIVHGTLPPKAPKEEAARPVDAGDTLYLKRKPLSTTQLTKTMEESRKAAVIVRAGAGHGSGFFIDKNGHILTNQHVVGDAHKVRIETTGKSHVLLGTVLRRNKVQDIALIRLDEIPDDLDITELPIRTQWPKVGEDVYAIGAPLDARRLQDTVTKGIVSAHRKKYKIFGTYMNLIQADVSIHGGNSGGPLLDANGNIVGLSVAGHNGAFGDALPGLNYFVPIEEAFDKLDIRF